MVWVLVLALIVSTVADKPDEVDITSDKLFPAGGDWDDVNQRFVVGSLTKGYLTGVDASGNIVEVGTDTSFGNPYGSGGVYIEGDVIYACVLDLAGSPNTFIYAFDRNNKNLLWTKNLVTPLSSKLDATAPHLCNDLIGDKNGNIYAVDSFGPIIWTIRTDGSGLDVFSTNDLYKPVANVAIGLDGIAYHPDGYLLIMHYGGAYLMKVPTSGTEKGTPTKVTDVGGASADLALPDGISLFDGDKLLVTSGLNGEYVLAYTSNDGWQSMTIYGEKFSSLGGSAALINWGGTHYVVNCHVGDLFSNTDRSKFEIQKVIITGFSSANSLVYSLPVVLAALLNLLM